MRKRALANIVSVWDTNVKEFVRDYKIEHDLWWEASGRNIDSYELDGSDWIAEEKYEDLLLRYVEYHADSYLEENFHYEGLHYEEHSNREHRFVLYSKMPVYQIVLAYSFQGVPYNTTYEVYDGSGRPTVGSKYVLIFDKKQPNVQLDIYKADSITECILMLRDRFISKWR